MLMFCQKLFIKGTLYCVIYQICGMGLKKRASKLARFFSYERHGWLR